MLAKRGKAIVSIPGGCAIGDRPVDLHVRGLMKLGAEFRTDGGNIVGTVPGGRLKGCKMYLGGAMGPTVLGTINVMCAAALAEGETVLVGAASEPEVTDCAELLIKMGAKIKGHGIMALAALTHAALIAERRRRHDIATMRALGLGHGAGPLQRRRSHDHRPCDEHGRRRSTRSIGPARTVWTRIAADAHFVPVTKLVQGQQVATIAGLALATSIALALPLFRSRQLRPITVLRTE